MGLMGPGGCGKSTLCRTACGLVKPDSGAVLVAGQDVVNADYREIGEIRSHCGVQFQNDALFEHMTILQNVEYPLKRLTDFSAGEIRDRAAERLHVVGLAGLENQMPSQLSGGQRKRVALARACVTDPEILICDDPTAGLDPVTSRLILDLIGDIHRQLDNTVLLVSSDVLGLMSVTDRIALIWDGKLVAEDAPKNFWNKDRKELRRFLDDARLPFGGESWS